MIFIDVREDGSERVKYDYPDYFAYVRKGLLSTYANFSAENHWHGDLEFIYILSGNMQYSVNGEKILLTEGEGVMVNADRLHYGYSDEKKECSFLCVLLHPLLLCVTRRIDEEIVAPILSDPNLPYLHLKKEIPWQREILERIANVYAVRENPLAPLYIQNEFWNILILLCENVKRSATVPPPREKGLATLKEMLLFVQERYAEPLSLDEIARAGKISKSGCLSLFKKYLHDTPVRFLTAYRLKKASELLTETDYSITDVALSVGFQGVSYFTERFRALYGVRPTVYRKNARKC